MCCFNCQSCGFRVPLAHNQRVPASCPGTFLILDVEPSNFSSFQDLRVEGILPAKTSKGYATSWVIRAWPPGGASEGATLTWMPRSHTPAWALGHCLTTNCAQCHQPSIQLPTSPALYCPPAQSPIRAEQSVAASDPPISCPTPLPAVPLATGRSPTLPSKFFLKCNRFTSDEPPSTDCCGI